ncbi:hypothetical protein Taro_049098, partial [Colocasia esculenta]|nr:hypothetical protein [Colocasia esculenta]
LAPSPPLALHSPSPTPRRPPPPPLGAPCPFPHPLAAPSSNPGTSRPLPHPPAFPAPFLNPVLKVPGTITCQLLGVIFEERTPDELQIHATVRGSVVEVLLEISKYCDVYLMETVRDDESEERALAALENAGLFNTGGLIKEKEAGTGTAASSPLKRRHSRQERSPAAAGQTGEAPSPCGSGTSRGGPPLWRRQKGQGGCWRGQQGNSPAPEALAGRGCSGGDWGRGAHQRPWEREETVTWPAVTGSPSGGEGTAPNRPKRKYEGAIVNLPNPELVIACLCGDWLVLLDLLGLVDQPIWPVQLALANPLPLPHLTEHFVKWGKPTYLVPSLLTLLPIGDTVLVACRWPAAGDVTLAALSSLPLPSLNEGLLGRESRAKNDRGSMGRRIVMKIGIAGVSSVAVLFCSTEIGRSSFVRQLEPDWHIDSNPEVIHNLAAQGLVFESQGQNPAASNFDVPYSIHQIPTPHFLGQPERYGIQCVRFDKFGSVFRWYCLRTIEGLSCAPPPHLFHKA